MLFFFERIAKIGRDNFPVKTILNIFLLMVGEAFVYKGSDEKKILNLQQKLLLNRVV
jgi:hypothetical protein